MRLGIDRVVEVLGVFAVDGHQRQVAQVDAPRRFRGIDLVAVGFRLAHRLGRELPRQIEARDGRFAGELDRLLRIEPLDDARLRESRPSPRNASPPRSPSRHAARRRGHPAARGSACRCADPPPSRTPCGRALRACRRKPWSHAREFFPGGPSSGRRGRAPRDTRTRSPCMTPAICGGGRNTASSWPSMRTKPKPARLALTTPSATRADPWPVEAAGDCGRRPPVCVRGAGFPGVPRDFPFLRFNYFFLVREGHSLRNARPRLTAYKVVRTFRRSFAPCPGGGIGRRTSFRY